MVCSSCARTFTPLVRWLDAAGQAHEEGISHRLLHGPRGVPRRVLCQGCLPADVLPGQAHEDGEVADGASKPKRIRMDATDLLEDEHGSAPSWVDADVMAAWQAQENVYVLPGSRGSGRKSGRFSGRKAVPFRRSYSLGA